MKRLTTKIPGVGYLFNEPSSKGYVNALSEKLGKFEDAEESGILCTLPCRLGGSVYRVEKYRKNPIVEMKVKKITAEYSGGRVSFCIYCKAESDCFESCYPERRIGTLLFLTRPAAEQEVEGMRARGEI